MTRLLSLRLGITPEQTAVLRRHSLFRQANAAIRSQETLIYYDTPAANLERRGVRLALRRQGGGWVQIVTTRPARWPGMMELRLWQSPYLNRFEFDGIDDAAVRDWLRQPKLIRRLRPVSECSFRRAAWTLQPTADVDIHAKLDRGWIIAAGRREELSELMLEIERGAVTDLYDVALALGLRTPLFPEALSRPERGRRLFVNAPRLPVKAGSVNLEPELRPAAAFRLVALDCLAQMHANHEGAVGTNDPEYVHQMRVATRRLRAAMRLFNPVLPNEFVEAVMPSLRELMAVLGRTRDLDVLLDEIVTPVAEAMPGEPRLANLMAVVTERLYQARRAAVAFLGRPDYARLHLTAGRLLSAPPFLDAPDYVAEAAVNADAAPAAEDSLVVFAERRLRRLLKATRAYAESARSDDPPTLHALRISIKRLRYGFEFFGTLAPKRSGAIIAKRLAGLQEELGQLNDLANAGQILMVCAGQDTALREAVTLIGGWHGKRHAELLAAIPDQLAQVGGLKIPRFAGNR